MGQCPSLLALMIIKIGLVSHLHWCHPQSSIVEHFSHRQKALRPKPLRCHSRNDFQITARTNLLPQLAENTHSEHHLPFTFGGEGTSLGENEETHAQVFTLPLQTDLVKTVSFLDGSSSSAPLRLFPPEIVLQHSTWSLRRTTLPSESPSASFSLCHSFKDSSGLTSKIFTASSFFTSALA